MFILPIVNPPYTHKHPPLTTSIPESPRYTLLTHTLNPLITESPRYTFLLRCEDNGGCLHTKGHRHILKDDVPMPVIEKPLGQVLVAPLLRTPLIFAPRNALSYFNIPSTFLFSFTTGERVVRLRYSVTPPVFR